MRVAEYLVGKHSDTAQNWYPKLFFERPRHHPMVRLLLESAKRFALKWAQPLNNCNKILNIYLVSIPNTKAG
jgi:hypothetical protein